MATREVAIPIADPKQLGEFIAGLLGQRRSIDRRFDDRRFSIDFDWLTNLDDIIAQRLAAQNAAVLVSFAARIYFGNGKIVTLEDRDSFRTFRDTSSELSVGIDLRWNYLIQFPLAASPEKQEIRFSAFTEKDILEKKPNEDRGKLFLSADSEKESLSYAIQFTDVTWGEDVSAHIGNYINSKTEPIAKWKAILRKVRHSAFPYGLLAGATLAMTSALAGIAGGNPAVQKYFPLEMSLANLKTIDQKVDFLVDVAATRLLIDPWPVFSSALGRIALWMAAIGLAYFLRIIRKASFINLNEHSGRYLSRYERNYDFMKYAMIAGFLVSTGAGIFANRIYDALKTIL
jgi:hypothetical protein